MGKKYKLKTIKEYLKDGPPQFDVILRREAGKTIEFHIASHNEEAPGEHKETLFPPDSETGMIQIVKRISDDVTFQQSEMVEAKDIGSCFIIEFKEDLIHCVVADIFEQEDSAKKLVEINDVEIHPQVEVGEVDLGGEKYDLGA